MRNEDLDAIWIGRCRDGDVEAFGRLVEKYQKPVFNVILRMVGSYEDASELAQQTFLKAFENLARFAEERRFFSWIYRIAINESINHLASRRRTEQIPAEMAALGPGPEEQAGLLERSRALHRAIAALEPEYGAAVVLRHFLHCSYREAAAILQVPETTVKSRLFTARHQLRDALLARGITR